MPLTYVLGPAMEMHRQMQLLRHLCIHAQLQDISTSSNTLLGGKNWALGISHTCRGYLALLNTCQWRLYKKKTQTFLIFSCLWEATEDGIHSPDFEHLRYRNSSTLCFILLTWDSYFSIKWIALLKCLLLSTDHQGSTELLVRHRYHCCRCLQLNRGILPRYAPSIHHRVAR